MINLELTVREAMNLATSWAYHNDVELYHKIVRGFENALNIKHMCNVNITRGMSTNNRINCIKHIRAATGWGLKESKDWTDALVGHLDTVGNWRGPTKTSNTLTLSSPEVAEKLLNELIGEGCEGYLS